MQSLAGWTTKVTLLCHLAFYPKFTFSYIATFLIHSFSVQKLFIHSSIGHGNSSIKPKFLNMMHRETPSLKIPSCLSIMAWTLWLLPSLLRQQHEDEDYCAWQLNLMKVMAISFRQHFSKQHKERTGSCGGIQKVSHYKPKIENLRKEAYRKFGLCCSQAMFAMFSRLIPLRKSARS